MTKQYELMCVFPGTLSEDELTPLLNTTKDYIEEQGGTSLTVEDGGKVRLAYPMKHIRYGYYYYLRFSGEPTIVPQIQSRMKLVTQLLRAIVHEYDAGEHEALKKRMTELQSNISASPQQSASAPAQEMRPVQTETPAVEKKPVAQEEKQEKIDIKDIDKKLDQILDASIADV
jgi:small subunit ribosomal protein S6